MTQQPVPSAPVTDVGGEVETLLASHLKSLTLEQKVRLLTGADFWSLHPAPDIGLRRLVVSDGPAGVRGELWDERDPSANVPSPTALAASWDTARVERIGLLLAGEARLEHGDADRHGWAREDGAFRLEVGRGSGDLALTGHIEALTVGG